MIKLPAITESNVRAFIMVWAIFLAGLLILSAIFIFNRMAGSDRLVDAQVKIYEAQAKTIGQPVVYEQHYYPPTK